MSLGNFVEVSIGVTELSESLLFFERLGFKKLDQNYEPWPWAVVTDGAITLNLSQYAGPAAPVLNYFASDMEPRVERLRSRGIEVFGLKDRQLPEVLGGIEVADGVGISLLKYPARRIPRPSGIPVSKCGAFSQLAFPVADIEKSLARWRNLDFERVGGGPLPYPWVLLTDGLITVGLHQTTVLKTAALVYETSNLGDRLTELQDSGFVFGERLPGFETNLGGYVLVSPLSAIRIVMQHR